MFCPKCGAQLPDGAKFCDKCGAPQQMTRPQNPRPAPPAKPKNSMTGVIIAIAAVCVLLVIVIVALIAFRDTWFGASSDPGYSAERVERDRDRDDRDDDRDHDRDDDHDDEHDEHDAEADHEHVFGGWTPGTDGHERVCADDGETETEPHEFTNWTATGSTHTRACTVCGQEEKENHDFGEWVSYDNDRHRHVCAVCGMEAFDMHIFDVYGFCVDCGAHTSTPETDAGGVTNGYLLPDSGSRYLTEADLANLTHRELCLARNEIYARHGRIFNTPEIAAYFNAQSWYSGTISPSSFSNSVLNTYETQNIELILNYENRVYGGSYY